MKSRLNLSAVFAASLGIGLAAAQTDTVNVLASYEVSQGFELLFDGVSASSFRNNLADYQQSNTTNTNLNAGWTLNRALTDPDRPGVVFGAMVTTASIVDSRTRKIYRNMDLRFDFRNDGNEGIVYRHDVSQPNNWYTGVEFGIDDNPNQADLNITAGSAYDVYAPNPPATTSYIRYGTNARWNVLRVVIKNDSVEHWMNGYKVVAFRYWSPTFVTAWQASKWGVNNGASYPRFCQTANNNRTYIPQGYWGFQNDHGGRWQIRRLRVLHDSLTSQNRVTLGPVQTGVKILSRRNGENIGYRFERRPGGVAFLIDPAAGIQSAELYNLTGRLLRRVKPGAASEVMFESSLFRKGLYLMRLQTASGVFQIKALIP